MRCMYRAETILLASDSETIQVFKMNENSTQILCFENISISIPNF